jgi:hypothetical protein
MQEKRKDVITQVLDILQDEVVLHGPIINFNHHQFTNVLELFMAFQKDKFYWLQVSYFASN